MSFLNISILTLCPYLCPSVEYKVISALDENNDPILYSNMISLSGDGSSNIFIFLDSYFTIGMLAT